jgi:hypothetical protein
MSFFILNRGKKSSKFWQVIVIYCRFVGFKEQLVFFEFCYEHLPIMRKKKIENKCAPIFDENVHFLGQNTKFSSSMWKIFPRSKFFYCAQVS